jgi:peptidoglycan/xylan/chitin deacetylase (PgdA/CDA1 family)
MNIIPVKTPKLVKHVLPSLVWNIETTEKVIYLTFDDGPTPEITDWVLNTLDIFNAKATFFCIGKNIEKHPDIFKNIIKKGHAIGNHTYDHLKGWKTNTEEYLLNINKAQNKIDSNYKTKPLLFRPPYGRIKLKQVNALSKLNYQIIMWNILSKDWDKTIEKEVCLKNVILNTKEGDIVVLHDSIKASRNMQYTLPRMLDHFTKEGYEFRRIPELTQ